MANIREHCSWIHEDRADATASGQSSAGEADATRKVKSPANRISPSPPVPSPIPWEKVAQPDEGLNLGIEGGIICYLTG